MVRTLVDEVRELLVKELADLNERVSDLAAIQYQQTSPDGRR